jgi:hypothetical protein
MGVGLPAALCGLVAAWIASGSAGLLGHPLRHGLTWLALGCAVLAIGKNVGRPFWASILILIAGSLTAAVLTASMLVPVNIFAVAVFLVAVAATQSGRQKADILLAAEAVTLLALFSFCRTSIPFVWQAADAVGAFLGKIAGVLTGRPLWVGSTFAGLDFLVPMLYIAVMAPLRRNGAPGDKEAGASGADDPKGSPNETSRKKGLPAVFARRIVLSLIAVVLGHLLYLGCLTFAVSGVASLPEAEPPDAFAAYQSPPATSIADILRFGVPWNFPILAVLIHALIAGGILYLAGRPANASRDAHGRGTPIWQRGLMVGGAIVLAGVMPLLVAPSTEHASLKGRKVVLYEKGFLNWMKPTHGEYGRLSIGMYGMLPAYLESLGAEALISPDLSQDDLRDADALILIYPDDPWEDGQLERIWEFVRQGGSLLLMGEHTVQKEDGGSRINDVIEPTSMRVRFDSAMFTVGGWLQSYEALWHPTSTGIEDAENDFGVVIGASVQARPPARPLLVGRWGWADPGDAAAGESMMGNGRYDAGEKLGDLLLAAEQPFGKGKIIVFGDTSNLSNGITIGCHEYTSRVLAYLADPESQPLAGWREWFALAAALAIGISLAFRPGAIPVAGVAMVASAMMTVCTARSHDASQVLPDGNLKSPNNLAYIDASHLEGYSRESWRSDGTMGLSLNLMRNGYLTLMLPELTSERLSRARLLVSVAPARPFSEKDRETVLEFVRSGGIFVFTAGHGRWEPSRELLSDLGFRIGALEWTGDKPIGGPDPLGHFKSPFFDGGDYHAYVRYHAAWPIYCDDPDALVVSYAPPDKPLIVIRRLGRGLVAVVGDTCFAMNKNLELESGEPFEGQRENAVFWRWFLALLGEGESWYPPKPESEQPIEDALNSVE